MFHRICGWMLSTVLLALTLPIAAGAAAQENSIPLEVEPDLPTLRCLGVRWRVAGDTNRNASVAVRYRRAGDEAWLHAMALRRIEPAGMRPEARPAKGEFWFAGSIFDLTPATPYDVELVLQDPDGGSTNVPLSMTTWSEPVVPTNGVRIAVTPDTWTNALAAARPGDILALVPGLYAGTVTPPSGEEGNPLCIVGPTDGRATLDGQGGLAVIHAPGLHHVLFEGLTLRNATYGISFNEGAHIAVKHCRFEDLKFGIVGQRGAHQERFYIADNDLQGRTPWPRTEGLSGGRGVQISGRGHVVCHNRIRGFDDAIDIFSEPPSAAIDIYGNEISACIDDGIEMDYSDHNTRCFENRLTSVFMGISLQPVHGGPAYVFRNVIYNVRSSPFKLHNAPSGVVLLHNTSVRIGAANTIATTETVHNVHSRNNLFVGTADHYAFEAQPTMQDCNFDYDGFACDFELFLKWNGERYGTMRDAQRDGLYPHGLLLDPVTLFDDGFQMPDHKDTLYGPLRNAPVLGLESMALDGGEVLANINEDFVGAAPDLGAYERGRPIPPYGPRPR